MIEYQDFSLKIEPKRGESYPVIVLHSPAGEGRSSFRLPFDPGKIGDILFDLQQTVRGSGRTPLRDVSPAATRTPPQRIGDLLFDALFSGPVRSLFDRSLGMIHGRQRGLRIKLHIDPEDTDLAQLASLPWEFLYRKETRDFLNLSTFTPILRYLDVQRPYAPLPLEPPLRILVVIADPIGCLELDLDRERALIESSWATQEGVQVEYMERASILALQDRLAARSYHVLHYMGHGDFHPRTGEGVLLMEDERGVRDDVDGSTLGVLLRDVPTMRLVFLNACETATVTRERGLDPFAGVAAAIVMSGLPAVVAMQFPISDEAAITFSRRFYPLLARGYPVDAAVAEGRRAIRLAKPGTMEWGTPVLFMRAPQGIIFDVTEPQRVKLPQVPELPQQIDRELERRLEQLYTDGLGAFWLEEWERACHSFQAIVETQPDYQDAAAKLEESKRRWQWTMLYERAHAAQGAGDWPGALSALEQLVAEAPEYKDASDLLEAAKKQTQLADLYAQARQLHQAGQWQAVVNVFAQIAAVEPDYPDPEGLQSAAQQEVEELERQAKLSHLYGRALREMDAGRWQRARQHLTQVLEVEPGYRESEQLLARVEKMIAHEEAERRRQEQIDTLYQQALGLIHAGQWRQALAKMDEIQALDPQFEDPERVAARAQDQSEKEEAEAERQKRLAALYAEAVRLLRAGQDQEALDKWEEVRALDAHYPDRQKVEATARKKLAPRAELAPPKRRLPKWAVVAGGGISLVAIVVAGVLLSRGLPGLLPTPTWTAAPTAAPAAVAPTPSSMPCQSVTSLEAEIKSPWLENQVSLDGKMSTAREWSDAVCLDLVLTQRHLDVTVGSARMSSRWWIKNDAQWVYLLVRVPVTESEGYGAWVAQYWGWDESVDQWEHSDSGSINQDSATGDGYGWDNEKWSSDVLASPPGENNVQGAASKDIDYCWFEFRKELRSGDGYDWDWIPGEAVDTGNLQLGSWSQETGAVWQYVRPLHLASP